jgi:hypothetical protein
VAIAAGAALVATHGVASAGSPDPSGQPMPRGSLPGWRQVFADDFTGSVPLGRFPAAVRSTWRGTYRDGTLDTAKTGAYMPTQVVSIGHGLLNIHLHTSHGVPLGAALVPTIPGATGRGGGQRYGRYVVRFRTDPVPGYKIAMLLWPDSGVWPRDGEIDFPEGNLNSVVTGYVHHQNGTSTLDEDNFATPVLAAHRWHTAAINWTPGRVTLQLDGRTIGVSRTRVPDTPMHLVIQAETYTDGTIPPPGAAGNVQIDWLAVYRRT